jgi:hypothetical protein
MHHRDFPLSDAVMDSRGCAFPSSPITVSARTCQQWQVPPWSWILKTWRVDSSKTTYGLYGVAANGLTICVCMLLYVCCICINSGGIVGGGGKINAIPITYFH